jgi:outer membrane protein OmpA-like peptidoglycan-associated protein
LQHTAGNRAVDELLQSNPDNKSHTVENVPPSVESVLQSESGQPLDSTTRQVMEPLFSEDFSQVRVHTGTKAAESADAVDALAYTAGQDVVFGKSQYAPETEEGRQLLIHELGHTVEQKAAGMQSSAGADRSSTIMRAPKPGAPEKLSLLGSKVPPPTITRVGNGILATVYFAKDNFLLDSTNFAMAEKLSEELRLMFKPSVMVDGHASTEGTEEYNQRLSELRRQAVIAILRSKLLAPVEFRGKAHGESEPAAQETAKEATELESQRAHNRRVTIFILSSPVEAPAPEKPKPIKLFPPPYEIKPETPEEAGRRIFKEIPPAPPKKSLSEMVWGKIDEGIDDILRKARVPKKYRGLVKDGARVLIEKGAEKTLDAALDQTRLSEKEKEVVKAAIKALVQTKF